MYTDKRSPNKRKQATTAAAAEPSTPAASTSAPEAGSRKSSRVQNTPNYNEDATTKGKQRATPTSSQTASQSTAQQKKKPRTSLPSHEVYSQKLQQKLTPPSSQSKGKGQSQGQEDDSDSSEGTEATESEEEEEGTPLRTAVKVSSESRPRAYDTIEGRYNAAHAQYSAEKKRIRESAKKRVTVQDIVERALQRVVKKAKGDREVKERIRKRGANKQRPKAPEDNAPSGSSKKRKRVAEKQY